MPRRKPHSPRTSIVVAVSLRPEVHAALVECADGEAPATVAARLIAGALGVEPEPVKRGRPRKTESEP